MPKFKFSTEKLENLLNDYAEIRQQTIPDTVVANARLLCVELARRTQPFGDSEDTKKTGEKAITRDLVGKGGGGTVRAGLFASGDFSDGMGYRWYAEGPHVRLFISKDGYAYGTEKSFFKENVSQQEMRDYHKSRFKNGKMSSAGGRDRSIGRWKFLDKWFVPQSAINSYIDSQILKVGWAKAAWAACARELRSVTKGSSTRGIPYWVTRHDSIYSDVIDNSHNLENPNVTLVNTTPYAHQVIPESEVRNAKAIVIQKMLNQMKIVLKKRQKTVPE